MIIYKSYHSYNGGVNNLICVSDELDNYASSTVSDKQAIENLKRKRRGNRK